MKKIVLIAMLVVAGFSAIYAQTEETDKEMYSRYLEEILAERQKQRQPLATSKTTKTFTISGVSKSCDLNCVAKRTYTYDAYSETYRQYTSYRAMTSNDWGQPVSDGSIASVVWMSLGSDLYSCFVETKSNWTYVFERADGYTGPESLQPGGGGNAYYYNVYLVK